MKAFFYHLLKLFLQNTFKLIFKMCFVIWYPFFRSKFKLKNKVKLDLKSQKNQKTGRRFVKTSGYFLSILTLTLYSLV